MTNAPMTNALKVPREFRSTNLELLYSFPHIVNKRMRFRPSPFLLRSIPGRIEGIIAYITS